MAIARSEEPFLNAAESCVLKKYEFDTEKQGGELTFATNMGPPTALTVRQTPEIAIFFEKTTVPAART